MKLWLISRLVTFYIAHQSLHIWTVMYYVHEFPCTHFEFKAETVSILTTVECTRKLSLKNSNSSF